VVFSLLCSWALAHYAQINHLSKCPIFPDHLLHQILDIAKTGDVILLDIPIGLRTSGKDERVCDKEARQLLKPKRSSSVFPAPCRPALFAGDYLTGSEINFRNTGRRLSQQSWAIAKKIKEVDEFVVRHHTKVNVREIHPEICFWSLNSKSPLDYPKKSRDGFNERLKLLSTHLQCAGMIVELAMNEFLRKEVARDDILDSLVGAITAMHPLKTIPEAPEIDDMGLKMEMVFAAESD
jgi:predicted RNase H-like nuclease